MKSLFQNIISIGIDKEETGIHRFGKTIFNVDCLLAIIGIAVIVLSHWGYDNFPHYLLWMSIAVFFNIIVLSLHHKKRFELAVFLYIGFHFIAIVLNAYITRSPIVSLYIILLGLSFLIYFGGRDKFSLPYFLFFSIIGTAITIACHSFPNEYLLASSSKVGVTSLILFFVFFLYKIIALVLQHKIALRINQIHESNLAISEKRYRNQFENNLVGMIVFGSDMRVVDVNPAFCKMIGYTKKELIDNSILETCLQNSPTIMDNFQKLHCRQINQFTTEKTFVRKNGLPLHTTKI